jgi:hypothetical protein
MSDYISFGSKIKLSLYATVLYFLISLPITHNILAAIFNAHFEFSDIDGNQSIKGMLMTAFIFFLIYCMFMLFG